MKMREKVMEGVRAHIQELSGFDKIELLEIEPGHCLYSIDATEKMLNHYGAVHGGALYTLCDIASGMAAYAYGVKNVTLSGNINYVRPAGATKLFVECNALHKGKTTVVQDVTVKDEEDKLFCTARMTMYIIGEVEE